LPSGFPTKILHALLLDVQAAGWTIGVLGFDSRRGLEIFLFTASRTALAHI